MLLEQGYTERYGNSNYRVLRIGDMKYWTMDNPLENTDLINRTYVDDAKRASIAEFVQSDRFTHKKGMSLADVEKEMKSWR